MQLGKQPDPEQSMLVTFRIIPGEGRSLHQAAEAVAAESSIGTWTALSTMQQRVLSKL